MTTAGGGVERAPEDVVRRAMDQSELPDRQREIVKDVLIGRIRRNAGASTREVDHEQLFSSVEQILGELARPSVRHDFAEPQPLSVEQVNSVVDSLCERYHLPWPICPADD